MANAYQLSSNGFIIRTADNAWIPQDPGNRDFVAYQAWLGIPGNTPTPAPIVNNTVFSKEAFWALFTPAEQAAITAGAETIAIVNLWLTTAQTYNYIDVASPLTSQGLAILVSNNLLTSAREAAILASLNPNNN